VGELKDLAELFKISKQ